MRPSPTSLSRGCTACIAAVLLSSLMACGGGGSAVPVAEAASSPSVITQSTITLPQSVQVVSAK